MCEFQSNESTIFNTIVDDKLDCVTLALAFVNRSAHVRVIFMRGMRATDEIQKNTHRDGQWGPPFAGKIFSGSLIPCTQAQKVTA